MKFNKLILIILIVFLKTGNLLSEDNIFTVNNIELIKKVKTNNQQLVNEAIEKGFNKLKKNRNSPNKAQLCSLSWNLLVRLGQRRK